MKEDALKPDLRIAVITPYYKESIEVLKRCHDSVMAQTYPATHFMIADGFSKTEVASWNVIHDTLPIAHGDYGNTPRCMGALSAASLGFDAIMFLDADNWFEPDHIETLVALQKKFHVQVVTATSNLRREDGSLLGVSTESDGINFIDTNSYLLMRETFSANAAWVFGGGDAVVGDRFFWKEIVQRKYSRTHSPKPTVNYVTTFSTHYLYFGEEPPKNAKAVELGSDHHWHLISYSEAVKKLKNNK